MICINSTKNNISTTFSFNFVEECQCEVLKLCTSLAPTSQYLGYLYLQPKETAWQPHWDTWQDTAY
jgi:hypothetical protein